MSAFVFAAVLLAALLHAGWNALIKGGGDKIQGMLALTVGHALVGMALIPFVGFPRPDAWAWLGMSVFIHAAYQTFLALAFSHGDLSRVYPISRGTAPLIVLVYGLFFLPDEMSRLEYAGILVLGLGIATMARGVFSNDESRRMLPFALGAAMATAGYTIADGQGARTAGSATVYIAWLMTLTSFSFTPVCIALRGWRVLHIPWPTLRIGIIAGFASTFAYWVALWAMTRAPIALVAALRETSVLFAVMLGVVVFREHADRGKWLAAVLIVSGAALTRL